MTLTKLEHSNLPLKKALRSESIVSNDRALSHPDKSASFGIIDLQF